MRIAHLSDVHFADLTFHPRQFLTKEWLGNANLRLFRNHRYDTAHLAHLPALLEELQIEHLFLSGDFTSTAKPTEFEEAKRFVENFRCPVTCVPGNHDAYTREAYKQKRFYSYLPHTEALKSVGVTASPLNDSWWYVALDCAIPTSLLSSNGLFSAAQEEELKRLLTTIPSHCKVIIINHFPLFPAGRPLHDLKRSDALLALLRSFPTVKLYLHGHDHTPYTIDRRSEGFPLVFNSGSCAHKTGGTFYLFELSEGCLFQKCLLQPQGTWSIVEEKNYLI